MSLSRETNTFLSLMGGCFCKVDIRYRTVLYSYFGSEFLGKNIPFEEFVLMLSNRFDFENKKAVEDEIYSFILQPIVTEHVFFATGTTGDKKIISISKENLDETTVALFFDNLDTKKGLFNLVDPLTNVYQKMAFVDYVTKKQERESAPYALFVMDIDNFKGINDNYGHLIGDEVLVGVAQVLKRNIKNGSVGRYGGDEFVCVTYQSTEYQEIWNLLYKITHEIYDVGSKFGNSLDVSVTVGVSRYGIDGTDYNELFVKADRALYRGKRKGKNCFIIYDDEKHRNINVDGVKKTIIDDRTENYSLAHIVTSVYDIINRAVPYEENVKELAEFIGQLFKVDRCVIYSESFDHLETPFRMYMAVQGDPDMSRYPSEMWNEHIKNNLVTFNKITTLEQINYPLFARLNSQNVASAMRVGLGFNGQTIGSIEIDSNTLRTWTIEEKNAMVVLGNVLSIYLYKLNENIYQEHKAISDSLTGTLNYQRFVAETSKQLNASNDKKVLYYFNLEKFKMINEKFGFKSGDRVLKEIAQKLKKIYGQNALISRVNGDRFMVFDEYKSREDIDTKILTLKEAILTLDFGDPEISKYVVFSCGVYVSDGTENTTSMMIDNANIARKSLTNVFECRYATFNNAIERDYKIRHSLELYLPEALKKEEFAVYLQPKIDIETGELHGAEALSRWNYKNEKMLMPNEFIPLLEHAGLITSLDFYVFEHVCNYLSVLKKSGKKLFPISVNLSRNVVSLIDYVEKLETIRTKYDIDPKYLEIEITESMFTANTSAIADIIAKLHELGYKISMDDFGSGYSNMSTLADCGFDIIKLDKSLVTADEAVNKAIILESVVNMIKKLKMDTICEGIETKEEAMHLLKLGCKIAQGYHYDKPMNINDFTNKYLGGE